MSPARAGSFNAIFRQKLSKASKACVETNQSSTKSFGASRRTLFEIHGQILDNVSESSELDLNRDSVDLEKLKQSVEQLETMTSIHQEDFNELINQMKELTTRILKLEARLNSI